MKFINEEFMLSNKTGKRLFYDYANNLPVIDYHCHISPKEIAENHKFENVGELMLSGDHYKWRLLRANGFSEEYVTGNAPYSEKFKCWAKTVSRAIGNPLFHWNQLELKRYFDIDEILTENNAEYVWNKCNEYLAKDEYRAQGLVKMSNVELLCTTDDPADTLEYHKEIKNSGFEAIVLPAFRPEKAMDVDKDTFLPYLERINIDDYNDLKNWLSDRIKFFNEMGCKTSDHSLGTIPYRIGDSEKVFKKALAGEKITEEEAEIFKTDILLHCAKEYTKYDWAMQLHIGPIRNNNVKMYETFGPDGGFDSMNDLCIVEPMAKLLNHLEYENLLPKTVVYNLNPKDNYALASMIGNFQKGPYAGKMQFGSGWWLNDNKDGMRSQLKALGNLGLLSTFIGMLTDSRSFVSYPRHEYFRRILCSLIGEWVEAGEFPDDKELLKEIVEGICYYNTKKYFGF